MKPYLPYIKQLQKRASILLLLLCFTASFTTTISWAQVVISGSDVLYIPQEDTLYIGGNLKKENTNASLIKNSGVILLNGHLINNSTNDGMFEEGVGKVIFSGDSTQHIEGDGEVIHIDHIVVNQTKNNNKVKVRIRTELDNTMTFQRGKVVLDTGNIEFTYRANIGAEKSRSYILGDSGYVVYQGRELRAGENFLGLSITPVTNFGISDIKRGHKSFPITSGSIKRFYEIASPFNASYSDLTFEYKQWEYKGNEDSLTLWKTDTENAPYFWNRQSGDIDITNNQWSTNTNDVRPASPSTKWTLADKNCDSGIPVSWDTDTLFVCQGDSSFISGIADTEELSYKHKWYVKESGNESALFTFLSDSSTLIAQHDKAGEFIYMLEISSSGGCKDTAYIHSEVSPLPTIEFTSENNCHFEGIFLDASATSMPKGEIINYQWHFGDGQTVNGKEFETIHWSYSEPGIYDVNLIVTSDSSCVDSLQKKVTVYPVPHSYFHYSLPCQDSLVYFQNLTIIEEPEGMTVGVTYLWDFGDGQTSTEKNPTHKYTEAGIFEITLTSTSNAGCEDSIIEYITVHPKPEAKFTYTGNCGGNTVLLDASSSVLTEGEPMEYKWTFEDEVIEGYDLVILPKDFIETGMYPVTLTLTTPEGCISSYTDTIPVYQTPTPDFVPEGTFCRQQELRFENITEIHGEDPDLISYLWDFGNGQTSTEKHPTYTYDIADTYEVKLVTTIDGICKDSTTQSVTIKQVPTVEFEVESFCNKEAVFTNKTTFADGHINYEWDFGDGQTSLEENPIHSYAKAGFYTITLTATADNSCEVVLTKEVLIDFMNNATAEDKINVNLGADITAYDSDQVILSPKLNNINYQYLWSTGETTSNIEATETGDYWVLVYEENGCGMYGDTVHVEIRSFPLPSAIYACGANTTLDAGFESATSFEWYKGTTLVGSEQLLEVTESGDYKLVMSFDDGENIEGIVKVQLIESVTDIISLESQIEICPGSSYSYTLSGLPAGTSVNWSNGIRGNTTHFSDIGSYWVDITLNESCGTYRHDIEVISAPQPKEPFFLDNITICSNMILDALNPNHTYKWFKDGVRISTNRTIDINTSGIYSVEVSTPLGCTITDQVVVEVNPSGGEQLISLGDDIETCNDKPYILAVEGLNGGETFRWSNNSIESTLAVTETGNYSVIVTTTEGCQYYDQIHVTVNPIPEVDIPQEISLCNDDYLMEADAQYQYQWFSSNGLISSSSSFHTDSVGKYWVDITTSLGCMRSDTIDIFYNPDAIFASFLAASQVYVGDTLQFVQLSYPDSIVDELEWDFGDGITSKTEQAQHIYLRPDTYEVVLTVSNESCSDTKVKTINVLERIEDPEQPEARTSNIIKLALYPNPTVNGLSKIDMEFREKSPYEIILYDAVGIELNRVSGFDDKGVVDLSVINQTTGVYLIKVLIGEEMKVLRLMRQ